MNLKLETEFSKAPILQEVDALKKQIDDMRPLPPDVEGRVMQKLRLDWNYNSNAIEGNKLSYGETVAFLMEGITAKGKPLKDHLDIRGHNEAINFLLDIVKDTRPISEADIRALHKMILVEPYEVKAQTADGLSTTKRITLGEYKTSANHVQTATGETHYYATPEETPAKMQELMEWFNEVSNNDDVHPVIAAALFHHRFVAIHPFDDGNGRLSRILMNLVLMQKEYPPVVVKMDDRKNYYSLLSRADVGEYWPFIEYIIERLQSSLQLYLKAINGGDIDEDEDIDKEIALLHLQMSGEVSVKEKKNNSTVDRLILQELIPLSLKVIDKLKVFQDLFFANQNFFNFKLSDVFGKDQNLAFYLNDDYLNSYTTLPKGELSEIDEVEIAVSFQEYKSPQNSFSLMVIIQVLFEQFNYRVQVDNDIIATKLYHEQLSTKEQNKIIKKVIQVFKNEFELKQKRPKS